MREMTIYVADDGSRWDSIDAAMRRDGMHLLAVEAESPLGPRPDLDGGEFKQHEKSIVASVQSAYEKLAKEYFGTTNGRVVSDSDNPVAKLMCRLMRIDSQGREWDQIWTANHPPHNPKEMVIS